MAMHKFQCESCIRGYHTHKGIWSSTVGEHLFLLLYKAEKPSVCPSVRLSDRHAAISAVSASIETRLARNES